MRKTTTSWTNRTPPLVTWLSRTDFRLGTALNTTSMWVGDSYLIPANRLTGVADVSCLGFELCSVFLYNYVDRFCCCCYWIKVVSWLCYGTLFYLCLLHLRIYFFRYYVEFFTPCWLWSLTIHIHSDRHQRAGIHWQQLHVAWTAGLASGHLCLLCLHR